MSQLTEAQKLNFIGQVQGNLASLTADLAAKDFSTANRILQLEAGGKAIAAAEVVQTTKAADALKATTDKNALLDANYNLASGTLETIAGLLTEDHPTIRLMRQIRSGMNHPAATPAPAKP